MSALFKRRDKRLTKRVAAFFYSPVEKPGFTAIPIGKKFVGYVRAALTPKHTTLIGALDWVHGLKGPAGALRYPVGECFMNSHYAIENANPAAIYIAVRGGSVQGVRYKAGTGTPIVFLVDYDNNDRDMRLTEEGYERECLEGNTWEEIEQFSEGVF